MKIALFGAVGLVVGLGAGTGVTAFKERKVLMAELVAQQDSVAAALAGTPAAEQAHGPAEPPESGANSAEGDSQVASTHPEDGGVLRDDPGEDSPGEVEESDVSTAPDHEETQTGAENSPAGAGEESPVQSGEGGVPSSFAGSETPANPPPAVAPSTQPAPATGDTLAGRGPERLAKIFGAMKAQEAAAVLEELSDPEIQSILRFISDRKAAEILSNLNPQRAAGLSRVVMGSGGGGTP